MKIDSRQLETQYGNAEISCPHGSKPPTPQYSGLLFNVIMSVEF